MEELVEQEFVEPPMSSARIAQARLNNQYPVSSEVQERLKLSSGRKFHSPYLLELESSTPDLQGNLEAVSQRQY